MRALHRLFFSYSQEVNARIQQGLSRLFPSPPAIATQLEGTMTLSQRLDRIQKLIVQSGEMAKHRADLNIITHRSTAIVWCCAADRQSTAARTSKNKPPVPVGGASWGLPNPERSVVRLRLPS